MTIRKSSNSGIPFGINSGRPANPQPGQPYFNGEANRLEIYTQTVGWQNIVQETPSVVNVIGALNENASSTITINGTNFAVGCIAYVVGTNGVETVATSTSLVSVVQLTATFPALSTSHEPYDVKVVNPSNLYGVLYDSLTVDNIPAWTTASGSLGTYIEQSPMSVTVSAVDPVDSLSSPLIYSITSGSLPGGLSINSATGVISGTPVDIVPNTTYSFTAAAYDGRNPAVTRNFSITITDRGPSWTTAATLPTFTQGSAYSTTLVATDDNGIASYSLFSGSLPTGLSLNGTTGVISGTPTGSTSATFTIRATDNGGSYVDRQFTMPNVGPSWSTSATLPTFTSGSAYSTTVVATDDSGATPTYSIVSGSLPTGLTLNSATGVISGTPTSSTTVTFTLRATDANGTTADRAFTMPNATPTWVTSGTISAIIKGIAYSYQLSATDDSGVAPTYSLVSGTLPTGITLSSTGLLSGTASGIVGYTNTNFTFRATDSNGGYADRTLTIPINEGYYAFTSFTFTNAGATGQNGPTLAQVQSAYSSTSWTQSTNNLNVPIQGYQMWTVPSTGTYRFLAVGACGGTGVSAGQNGSSNDGGYGASAQGDYALTIGDKILIAVGQAGQGNVDWSGGAGGSFVALGSSYSTASVMLAAGGGGGWSAYSRSLAYKSTDGNGGLSGSYSRIDANSTQIGNSGYGPDAFNTNYGYGGGYKGAGAGFYSAGSNSSDSGTQTAAQGFRQGLTGGNAETYGGFGGGGGGKPSAAYAGSGGGWTGGNGTDNSGTGGGIPGGAGTVATGSGSNFSTARNANTTRNANGYVTVTKL